MSESFTDFNTPPFDTAFESDSDLAEINRNVDLHLDFDLDSDLGHVPHMSCGAGHGQTDSPASDEATPRNLHELNIPVPTLTNSPGCLPKTDEAGSTSRSSANSKTPLLSVRRARGVRVDAWAVPASANWGRSRRTMRKVSRVSRSTDWALPF